jgi:hypothetical protein
LACEACGFDFRERYGERGEGFIECHPRQTRSHSETRRKNEGAGPPPSVRQLPPHGSRQTTMVNYGATGSGPAAVGVMPGLVRLMTRPTARPKVPGLRARRLILFRVSRATVDQPQPTPGKSGLASGCAKI